MRIVIIGILYVTYMLLRCPQWLASQDVPYILRALSYSFFHTNLLHLAVNCLSVWILFPESNDHRHMRELCLALLIAFAVYPLGFRPCVGFSNALFAICGMRSKPLSCTHWWKQPTVILFLVIMVAMCFMHQFAGTNHLAAFILGFVFMNIEKALQPLIRDASRYTRDR